MGTKGRPAQGGGAGLVKRMWWLRFWRNSKAQGKESTQDRLEQKTGALGFQREAAGAGPASQASSCRGPATSGANLSARASLTMHTPQRVERKECLDC